MNRKITTEMLMVNVLKSNKNSLTLGEIVNKIRAKHPDRLNGKTPTKSLYSMVFRKERDREQKGERLLFKIETRGGTKFYSLNAKLVKVEPK